MNLGGAKLRERGREGHLSHVAVVQVGVHCDLVANAVHHQHVHRKTERCYDHQQPQQLELLFRGVSGLREKEVGLQDENDSRKADGSQQEANFVERLLSR